MLTQGSNDVGPQPGSIRPALQSRSPSPPAPAATFVLLFCALHLPCRDESLPHPLSCPPHLTPGISFSAQTAMEVEGIGEDEEQRGRRLSDFYDIHQEIGRCGAQSGYGVWGPIEAGPEARQHLSPVLSSHPHPGVPSPTCAV